MARDNDQSKFIDSSDFLTVLASEGVEFLLSRQGKVISRAIYILFFPLLNAFMQLL